jgi:hypothetical protein
VEDAAQAYEAATAGGARGCLEPTTLTCEASGQTQTVAEVELYGDVRLRLVSGSFQVGGQARAAGVGCLRSVPCGAPCTRGALKGHC